MEMKQYLAFLCLRKHDSVLRPRFFSALRIQQKALEVERDFRRLEVEHTDQMDLNA